MIIVIIVVVVTVAVRICMSINNTTDVAADAVIIISFNIRSITTAAIFISWYS